MKMHNIWHDAGMLHHLHLWPKFSKASAVSFQNNILNLVHSAETLAQPWDVPTESHIVIFMLKNQKAQI